MFDVTSSYIRPGPCALEHRVSRRAPGLSPARFRWAAPRCLSTGSSATLQFPVARVGPASDE